ncbi:unnamed protein product [Oikopleura dioica]|uniref:Uncharacterized protein n=1 Tax=Oikopleura dioica TaxID=34765 RepID=E4XJS3_OIKDI|nr:unnamed protein product [Oikopleura dioica]CBY24708.1 unnamed protein product [Oikopleura dioica]
MKTSHLIQLKVLLRAYNYPSLLLTARLFQVSDENNRLNLSCIKWKSSLFLDLQRIAAASSIERAKKA